MADPSQQTVQLKWSKYIKQQPFLQQLVFLSLMDPEAFYGGATKGGKTSTLLMCLLQYADVPNYAGLFLRKTSAPLMMPDGALARAHEWLKGEDARWNQELMTYFFPNGGQIVFGFLEHSTDRNRYQGPNFQTICPDELTQFPQDDYEWMFSRMSRPAGSTIPLRMRGAANPPETEEGEWVYDRFLVPGSMKGPFVPARLEHNIYVDQDATDIMLQKLDPIRYAALRRGDWNAKRVGTTFKVDKMRVLRQRPWNVIARIRYWDKASTEGGDGATTCGILMSKVDVGLFGFAYVVEHMVQGRWSWRERNKIIRDTAEADGIGTTIWIEQEGGSGGQESAEISIEELDGFDVHVETVRGDKEVRARPFAAQMEADMVAYVEDGTWDTTGYKNSLRFFPKLKVKDPVDASGGAHNKLATRKQSSPPRAEKQEPLPLPAGYKSD